jgi:hypothetical protein
MKKIISLFVFIFCCVNISVAQFFYSDILLTQQGNSNYLNLKNNKVKKVTISNDSNEDAITINQSFSDNWNVLLTEAQLSIGITNTSTQYYQNNLIIKKEEEIKNVNSSINYYYTNRGKLSKIISKSIDTSINKSFEEDHIFIYNDNDVLTKMLKIKNSNDTTFVDFLTDEKNNIIEERWTSKKKLVETYYYFYNKQNLITDIVKFNLKVNKMLPEFLFEYNEQNKLIQLTQIPFGSSNYIVWKFSYNDKQLKEKEIGFNKKGEKVGEMIYRYQYN